MKQNKTALTSSLLIAFSLLSLGGLIQTKAQTLKHQLLMPSALESTDFKTVTLPIFQGRADGEAFWYVVTESSDQNDALKRHINFAPKLGNLRGSSAVQPAKIVDGILEVSASVDFSANWFLNPGSSVIPPENYEPGSVAQAQYAPLIELPNGIVLNASQVANQTGVHDRVIKLDTLNHQVSLFSSQGFFEGSKVWFTCFEASAAIPATLEFATFTPKLNLVPRLGESDDKSSRNGIAIFMNGQSGSENPNRQGLLSYLYGEGDPQHVFEHIPDNKNPSSKYSPLMDAHVSVWSSKALKDQTNTLQTRFSRLPNLAAQNAITATDGTAWKATGFVQNCPIISLELSN
jgi:hypothetical protein